MQGTSAWSLPRRGDAARALGRVGSAEARPALSARASVESDASVLGELSAALEA